MLEMIGVMVVTMVNHSAPMIMTMTTMMVVTVPVNTKVSFYAALYHLSKWNKTFKYVSNMQKLSLNQTYIYNKNFFLKQIKKCLD